MANTKISQLTANTNPSGSEEMVYALNNANGKISLNTMKTFVENNLTGYATTSDLTTGLATKQDTLVSGTNIRTINGASVMGSGDIIVTGGTGYTAGPGIDITGGVISATGGGVTELTADANIWELNEGIYETEYNLYYTSGNKIPRYNPTGGESKQRIEVMDENGTKIFFAYGYGHINSFYLCRCSFGYSASSSLGKFWEVGDWKEVLKIYYPIIGTQIIDGDIGDWVTQIVSGVDRDVQMKVRASLYPGVTYTAIITSVASGENYTITIDGTTVTNPLNITLPSSSTKPCVVTFVASDDSHAILTGCVIGS